MSTDDNSIQSPPTRDYFATPEGWTGYRHPTNRIYRDQYQQQEPARQVYLNKYHKQKSETDKDPPHPGG